MEIVKESLQEMDLVEYMIRSKYDIGEEVNNDQSVDTFESFVSKIPEYWDQEVQYNINLSSEVIPLSV